MPVGRGAGGHCRRKNRETVTAPFCLVFMGRGLILTPSLIKSINNLFKKKPVKSGKYDIDYVLLYSFETF